MSPQTKGETMLEKSMSHKKETLIPQYEFTEDISVMKP